MKNGGWKTGAWKDGLWANVFEFTLRRNREVFDWAELVPKGVVNVSPVQTATEVLGMKMAFPIMVSPSASLGALHPEGEMAMRQGATAANTTYIISQNASFPIDKIAAAAKGPVWSHFYAQKDPDANRELVERAQAAGCQTIVVTADDYFPSYRERSLHDRHLASRGAAAGAAPAGRGGRGRGGAQQQAQNPNAKYGDIGAQRPWLDWKLMDKLRPYVKVPLLAKGILTAEDARLCVKWGFNAIYVSNHGGRELSFAPSSLEVLPEIVDAVQGRVPVIVDSGFRRGSDVLKALALGAKAVCLGRVPRWGLAAYGAAGAQRVLEILQGELVMAMAATGRPTLDSIDRTLVRYDFS